MTAAVQPGAGTSTQFGVHSEVGKLRKVMIHRPDLELSRLTPTTTTSCCSTTCSGCAARASSTTCSPTCCATAASRSLYLEELLARVPGQPEARKWVLDRAVTSFTVGAGMFDEVARLHRRGRSGHARRPPHRRADRPRGAASCSRARATRRRHGAIAKGSLVVSAMDATTSSCRPLPNSYFTRDPSRLDLRRRRRQPDVLAGRRLEALNVETIYRFHPDFRDAGFKFWYSREDEGETSAARAPRAATSCRSATATVAIGMSERTTGQMIEKIALGAVRAGRRGPRHRRRHDPRPGPHAPRHGVHVPRPRRVTMFPKVVELHHRLLRPAGGQARASSTWRRRRPSSTRSRTPSSIKNLRVIGTGGDAWQAEREQWDDGNNVVALEPGVVVAYESNEYTNTLHAEGTASRSSASTAPRSARAAVAATA